LQQVTAGKGCGTGTGVLVRRVISCMLMLVVSGITACKSTTIINSEPQGAKIYINDEYRGETPYTHADRNTRFAITRVRLEKQGYKTNITDIDRMEMVIQSDCCLGYVVLAPVLLYGGYTDHRTLVLTPAGGDDLNLYADMKTAAGKPAKKPAGINTVYLQDGSEIVGRMVGQTSTHITMETRYATLTINRKKISKIK
jgi:hypothetical protein